MTPQFRFTLFHTILAPSGLVVPQPDGWKNSSLVLERHPDFHSLVETFQGEFIFWGSAMRFLQSVEALDGPDATLRIYIEISFKIGVFEELFDGLIDISEVEEINIQAKKYKYKVPIVRNDFWTKLINRRDTKVNLLSTLDLDGGTRVVRDKFTLPMPSQTIRSSHRSENNDTIVELSSLSGHFKFNSEDESDPHDVHTVDPFWNTAEENKIQVGFFEVITDEVKDLINSVGIAITEGEVYTPSPPGSPDNSGIVAAFLRCKYDGAYRFEPRLELSIYSNLFANNGLGGAGSREYELKDHFASAGLHLDVYLQVNNETPILFDKTDSPLVSEKVSTIYTLDETLDLLQGDEVKIFVKVIDNDWETTLPAPPFSQPEWGNEIVNLIFWGDSNLIFPERNSFVFLDTSGGSFFYAANVPFIAPEFNAGDAPSGEESPTRLIITADTTFQETETDALLLKDAFQNCISKLVGADGPVISETFDSCKGLYAIMKGLHQRGYGMDEKPFAASLNDLWSGTNPTRPMGLGYKKVFGVDKVEIESREAFYNKSATSINISNVSNAVRTYDFDLFFKQIEVGYSKWSAESESGIDDPQTKRTYFTRFSKLGKDEKQLSTFIAASLAIEQTRRNRVEFGKDWRLDEDIMIIALKAVEDGYSPEVGTDFASITNLLNSDTRINVRLSAARNFERWRNWYNGCLITYTGEQFKFGSGEGNFDMVSTLNAGDCDDGENNELSEKQNIDATENTIVLPTKYEFKHPFTWTQYKQVRDNRNLAIGINFEGDDFFPHFIKRLEWKIMGGFANFTVNLASLDAEDLILWRDLVPVAFHDNVDARWQE